MNVFRPAGACLLLVLSVALTGCGGSSTASSTTTPTPTAPAPVTPTPVANTGAAKRIYVVQQPQTGNGTVLQFAATSSGSVSPAYTLAPGAKVSQVATDQVGNIYFFNGNIVEYSTETTGTPSLVKQITAGTASRICCVDGLAVSPSGAVVLGQDNGEVDEWPASATGAVGPARYIPGYSETGGGMSPVIVANQVAVDSAENLYVRAAGAPGSPLIAVFGASATGNVAPSRTLGTNGGVGGVTANVTGSVYATTSSCTGGATPVCTGTIVIYGAGSSSSSPPSRVITGSATQLHYLGGIQVDALGSIYVISTDVTGANPAVLTFAATASGNTAPIASFSSSAWTSPDFNPSMAIY